MKNYTFIPITITQEVGFQKNGVVIIFNFSENWRRHKEDLKKNFFYLNFRDFRGMKRI